MASRKSKAFTLIELLIVIVIIGILAGVVLAILNPARQQQRAREAVFQANVSKYCTALMACASTTTNAQKCDTIDEIGVISQNDKPITGSGYYLNSSAATYSDSAAPATTSRVYLNARYAAAGCTGECSYDFNAATPYGASFGAACITN